VGNRRKHISHQKRAATKKADKRHPDPALLTPRHGWDEVAHNWEALHAEAEECQPHSRTAEVDSLDAASAQNAPRVAAKKPTRKDLLEPMLAAKGFSVRDWAIQADVDFHTARDYRNGKTRTYRTTRKKLADALGIRVEDLPA